ncbi:lamin tail domain-containing protein [Streptosporangium roseum]|uniref:lamin tail domain-containing protein n=1 Tax=Streptosporangium roseum TaxID=2001 RepID=UPI003332726D
MLAPAVPAQATRLPAVQIMKVYYDSPGSDLRSNASLNGEYVTIRNTTRRAIDLAGRTLRDKAGYTYTFGGDVLLGAGKKLTIRSGQGGDGTSSVFWGRRAYVWNNDKDSAYIRNACGCGTTTGRPGNQSTDCADTPEDTRSRSLHAGTS